MTGAAIQALVAAGRRGSGAVDRGLDYLRDAQAPDGGFPALPGESESNAASTAWAVQAIWAVGENPETWLTGGGGESEEPLDYMASLQEPDGHIRWKRSDDINGVWMTAFVAPAFAGQTWPIPAAPRALKSPPGKQPGSGGAGAQRGDGVIAGGGGAGAPLFSRPKPQSKGRTPGGARVVRNAARRAQPQRVQAGRQRRPANRDGNGRIQRRARRQRLLRGQQRRRRRRQRLVRRGSTGSGVRQKRLPGAADSVRAWPRGRRRQRA